ncbi:heparan-sulfate 6-O-sulfotransferase 2-like [Artemia franciscana]|uniref:Heparan-sulfate 6-O-sulfotransferase n=1 Tax=Artemia franciscana TaxID=6661 RepID=A0AA88HET7_ARTSF|nr:hypothetical protein QYM36_017692 [Artemia franciscana]KAK2703972.1 hypothetical protein QYM36_017692 [Artemia franciscana]KAK2703973.1 hypothetical protein QYM36_017692 [Artemia franciscana]
MVLILDPERKEDRASNPGIKLNGNTTDSILYSSSPRKMSLCGYALQIRFFVILCVGLSILGIIIGSHCSNRYCSKSDLQTNRIANASEDSRSLVNSLGLSSDDPLLNLFDVANVNFEIRGNDVMVFLHIQKTGGTQFGRHLVKDLDLERPCACEHERKRCDCLRPGKNREIWLFSRFSVGWKCGLHADWTELTECVDRKLNQVVGKRSKRRYYYVTFLRDPLSRFLSEFRHVQRGATWKNSKHSCDRRSPTEIELPRCYDGERWTNVTLENFMSCPYNLAINRQTRMLADLKLVGCYNMSAMSKTQRDRIVLASAKLNLSNMPFLGLTEKQQMSQYIFERTFKMKFLVPFEQHNVTVSSQTLKLISEREKKMVLELNNLDVELYEYALKLFNYRFSKLKSLDTDFEAHYQNIISSNGQNFTWDSLYDEDADA